MFWLVTLVGGGIVWNGVDSIGGLFLATDGMIELFSLVCGMVFLDAIYVAFLTSSNDWAKHAMFLCEVQIPLVVLLVICGLVSMAFKGEGLGVGLVLTPVVAAVVAFNIWVMAWLVGNTYDANTNGNGLSPYFLSQMHLTLTDDSNADYANFRHAYLQATLGHTAIIMSFVAAACALVITSLFRTAFDAFLD
ncbi:MAG TPA: hypothetical protein VG992_04110 [Candidatus Saccharimonadales bacterium]|nr:hypothetical protein [Candidatus Saccharimonadales bacterium]